MGEHLKKPNAKDVAENRLLAILSYFGILFLVPLLLKPESKLCQYHARQGIVLFIFEIIYGVLSAIPLLGWFIVAPVGGIVIVVLFLMGISSVLAGENKQLPVIGQYGEKF